MSVANQSQFDDALVAHMPNLRKYAISLCKNVIRADDLVQETILRALSNKDKFVEGTNLAAWLTVILRNMYFTEQRKRRREVEDGEGFFEKTLTSLPNQEDYVMVGEMQEALESLPQAQRSAVLAVAMGDTYEEMAARFNVKEGTIKSRINRARNKLTRITLSTHKRPLTFLAKPRLLWQRPTQTPFGHVQVKVLSLVQT